MNKLADWGDYADALKNPQSYAWDEEELKEAGESLEEAASFARHVEFWTRPGMALTPESLRENINRALGFPESFDDQWKADK